MPSPDPYSIVEASLIRDLVADGVVVIAAGGGGVPVVDAGARLVPTEGVVDKDLAAAILAHEVETPTCSFSPTSGTCNPVSGPTIPSRSTG